MHNKMAKPTKKRALAPQYQSSNQLKMAGFETPFERELRNDNRWVVLAHLIPWDDICGLYEKHVPPSRTGRPPLNPRIILGALIIKHMCNLDDRETVDQISENIYMQYFLGYSSFTSERPFDASLFPEIRKRLGLEAINDINERIALLKGRFDEPDKAGGDKPSDDGTGTGGANDGQGNAAKDGAPTHKGKVIMDATACPQAIAYPTDLNLANQAREKLEELIDLIHKKDLHGEKPRDYRVIARSQYLGCAQKKGKTKQEVGNAVRQQLRHVKRDIRFVHKLLDAYDAKGLPFPLKPREQKYFFVVQAFYGQQTAMYVLGAKSVEHRIVSIHQPHVRPIVRGKEHRPVEFGAKINVSLVNGIAFLDDLSWEAFNEGSRLVEYVEHYRKRFGYYPCKVLADQIYCTKANRKELSLLGVKLVGKPLGKATSDPALSIHVSPGERNPIEGKFGQGKTGYGLDRVLARLQNTSESWIASIFLVLNLVSLAGAALLCQLCDCLAGFSAQMQKAAWTGICQSLRKDTHGIYFDSNYLKTQLAA